GRPGDVRGDDAAGRMEQRVVRRWRLLGEHVEGSAGDDVLAQRARQGGLVDHLTAARVDQKGAGLHPAERALVDEVLRLRGEGTVEGDDVALPEQGLLVDEAHAWL